MRYVAIGFLLLLAGCSTPGPEKSSSVLFEGARLDLRAITLLMENSAFLHGGRQDYQGR